MAQIKPKKRKFNLYDFFNGRDGKGVEKHPDAPRNLKFFFSLYRSRFGTLFTLNLMMVLGNFPILFFLFALSGNLNHTSTAPTSALYPVLYGITQIGGGTPLPILAPIYGILGQFGAVSVPSTATYIFYAIGILTVFTAGFVNVGATYILRSMVREDPIFLWSDYRYAMRRNWKQALGIGLFDSLALVGLVYGAVFYYMNTGRYFFMNVAFYFFLFVAIIYLFMRPYIYLMAITFDLKFRKMLKNALIFSLLGFKRNVLAALGVLILGALVFLIIQVYLPLGIILPFILLLSHTMFYTVYAAYPVIQKYMIDPCDNKQVSETEEAPAEDPSSPLPAESEESDLTETSSDSQVTEHSENSQDTL